MQRTSVGYIPTWLARSSLHWRKWLAYDEEADVLYVNFKKPSHADDSELMDYTPRMKANSP